MKAIQLRFEKTITTQAGNYQVDIWGKGNAPDWDDSIYTMLREYYKKEKTVDLLFLQQVHGNDWTELSLSDTEIEADGYISYSPFLCAGIKTADCIPILFYHKKVPVCGGIHAGWKGLKSRIVPNMMKYLTGEKGHGVEDFEFFIGPFIGSKNYEVEKDVYDVFSSDCFYPKSPGKWNFDMKIELKRQLESCTIDSKNITWISEATYANRKFFSHRCHEKGRNISIIYRKT